MEGKQAIGRSRLQLKDTVLRNTKARSGRNGPQTGRDGKVSRGDRNGPLSGRDGKVSRGDGGKR